MKNDLFLVSKAYRYMLMGIVFHVVFGTGTNIVSVLLRWFNYLCDHTVSTPTENRYTKQ